LTIGQSWIILYEKMLGELGENLGLRGLREEVREDVPQRIPRRRQALARQIAIQLKNCETVKDTIFIRFLVQVVVLTHLPCWIKEGLHQHQR
jgi:hypothetical protein